ncbi:DMT family transporter [uncultured Propionivibrio sp.]|uniref:DMT family transporter n=1 Tax=uncultured Propionivibrio sp. TaxID=426737 RepID=UPI0029C018A6|nr:DMT family transporter [uncultured Propionivibrio sp.]
MPTPDKRRGITLAVMATIFYAIVDALSKYQARTSPVELIVWARYGVPLVLLLAFFLPQRGIAMLRTGHPWLQIARGLLLTGGTLLIVLAYRVMPIAEAQAIFFIHPVLLTLLAVLFLGEKVSPRGWLAVVIGFAGVLIIVRPGGGLFRPAALLPLGLALTFSTYQIFTRIIAGKENSINSLFWVLAVGTASMSIVLPFAWTPPSIHAVGMLTIIGIVSGFGHFSTIKALEYAPASLLAPFAYVQLVWVAILGALMFGDFPDGATLIGIATVATGGLLVVFSKRPAGEPERSAAKPSS